MTVTISISDMRAAGKLGYVAKIVDGERSFLQTSSRTGHSKSRETLMFEISEDGIYEVCDANFGSRKRNIYFIRVQSGEEQQRTNSLSELIVKSENLNFPELAGSIAQITWAEQIRQKTSSEILRRVNPEHKSKLLELLPMLPVLAKEWIDNRDNSVDWAMSKLKQLARYR